MYQIKSAYGLAARQGAVWQEHDISQLTGMQIYSLFTRLYITLTSNYLADPVSINAATYEPLLSYDGRTMQTIFADWTDPTPLTAVEVPKYKTAHAVFTDAFRAGYQVNRSIPGAHFTSSTNNSLRTEMQVNRVGLDMRVFNKYCLITANGYYYKGEATADVLYVPEAGKTLQTSRYNHVGILSFESVGEIKTYSLDKDSVITQAQAGGLYDGINVKVPEVELEGKTLMLVCMGQLYGDADGVFTRIGNGRAVIHPRAMYLFDRYAESWNFIDWRPVLKEWTQPHYVNTVVMESDDAMRAMVEHYQTFWVVIDTPHISKVRLPVRSLPMPGCFQLAKEPTELMVAGTGYVLEYWKRNLDGIWSLNCSGVMPGFGVRGTLGRDDLPQNLSMANLPYVVLNNIQACMLDLVADEIPDED